MWYLFWTIGFKKGLWLSFEILFSKPFLQAQSDLSQWQPMQAANVPKQNSHEWIPPFSAESLPGLSFPVLHKPVPDYIFSGRWICLRLVVISDSHGERWSFFDVVEKVIDIYAENGQGRERLGNYIDRIGLDEFKKLLNIEEFLKA